MAYQPLDIRVIAAWRSAVGSILRSVRESRKLTQEEVATNIGWSRTTLVAIERGRQAVSLDQLVQLAARYGVSIDSLIPLAITRPGDLRVA